LGAPEIIVFDLPQNIANSLFHEIHRQLKAGELVIHEGDLWGEDSRAAWREVHPTRLDDGEQPWLGLAQTFDVILTKAPREFEAFQLVLADPDGHFPWDAEYDERLRPLQRELYLPLGAATD
jgi:hypothetical protein